MMMIMCFIHSTLELKLPFYIVMLRERGRAVGMKAPSLDVYLEYVIRLSRTNSRPVCPYLILHGWRVDRWY